ncbi:MAG: flagellar biosynthesis protein FlhB [Candidatus Cloacimonetes bacterium]|nr:flagellar biosynthesis protein FlhB [Candidatus Cloacimonadota bacterium]
MADEQQDQEKTEMPTARRKRKARDEGNVAKSSEVDNTIFLLSAIALFKAIGGFMMRRLEMYSKSSLIDLNREINLENVQQLLEINMLRFFIIILPFALTLLMVSFLSSIIQVGWLWTTKPLKPQWNKAITFKNPFAQMFSLSGVQNIAKSLFKVIIVGLVSYFLMKSEMQNIMNLIDMDVYQIFSYISDLIIKYFFNILIFFIAFSVGDYALTKYIHTKKLKMTKSEVKDERRQMEGDPQVRSKLRSLMFEEARKRMMSDIPKADVVITNPIHLAVALKYEPEKYDAPYVLAKGKRLIAEKIKEIAREHKIPIIEDKPLARMLYDTSKVGQQISPEIYAAVAEIIAQIYKMKNQNFE